MENVVEIINVVISLNDDLYTQHAETIHQFSYQGNGGANVILFDDEVIWSSEDDQRMFDEENNDYEPLEPYIKKVFNNYLTKLNRLKL